MKLIKIYILMIILIDVLINVYQHGMLITLLVLVLKHVQVIYLLITQQDYVFKNVLNNLITMGIIEFVISHVHHLLYLLKMILDYVYHYVLMVVMQIHLIEDVWMFVLEQNILIKILLLFRILVYKFVLVLFMLQM